MTALTQNPTPLRGLAHDQAKADRSKGRPGELLGRTAARMRT